MHSNQYGQVFRDEKEIIDLIYQNPNLDITKVNFADKDVIVKFNESAKLCELDIRIKCDEVPAQSIDEFDKNQHNTWFMPNNYCPDLIDQLYSQCISQEQTDRINQELELFIKHDMMDLLFYLKYLVDTFRQHNIVWGVGRGSSVASYVLYLIGVHKVDSIKYNLDIGEFLK